MSEMYDIEAIREAVRQGKIPARKEIPLEMNRIDDLIANHGVYYDIVDGVVYKDKRNKPPMHLVPPEIMTAIAYIREYGNKKYGSSDGWKNVDIIDYVDAGCRHYMHILKDPYSIDEESGLPHVWHVACNLAFIISMMGTDLEEIKRDQGGKVNG